MNITIWLVIALVCFVLPSIALTNGGGKTPEGSALARYAKSAGLPLTEAVVGPVVERIRRRERGMLIGGLIAIVLGALASMIFDGAETWGALVVMLAGAGTAFGGALAMAGHRPEPTSDRPVVARSRSTQLADYLTAGERFGFWSAPVVLLVAAAPGTVLLLQVPAEFRGASILFGLLGTGLALVTWGGALLALRRVLAAPARSGSDLELAWDDAERALGLRQVANLVVAVACFALGLWLVLMAQSLTSGGFYRQPGAMPLTYILSIVSLGVFGVLIAVTALGPVRSWASGERKGYEQRRLWPNGVRL